MTSIDIDEYEHRFNEIDSELDALRSSILDDNDDNDNNDKNDDNDSNDDDDDNDDDVQIAYNNKQEKKKIVAVKKDDDNKGVILAEQSAIEMEKIVQTLREQQKDTTAGQSSSSGAAQTTRDEQQQHASSSSSSTKSYPNKSPTSSPWSLLPWFIFIIPIIVSIILAWKLHHSTDSLTAEGDGGGGSSSIAVPESSSESTKSGGILNKLTRKKKKRERCQTTIDGQKYCESEEESTVPGTNQRIATFQKCWYINDGDESYCESFETQEQEEEEEQLLDGNDDNNVNTYMPLIMTLEEEFVRADTNNDGYVTKMEFDKFKNDYISNHPADGITIEANFAKFDDFDINLDGQITQKEHQQYYNKKNLDEEKVEKASLETTTRRKQQQQQQHRNNNNNNNNINVNIKLKMMAKQVLADEFFEFFTADTNKDRQVDRIEFDTFKRNYLKIHREMTDDDFDKFDEFDMNNNGYVTIKEYERYYKNQQQQQRINNKKSINNNNKNNRYLFTRGQLMDEFVMADTNKNGQVDRKEFDRYKRNYLQIHPEMSSENFAKFDDFDPDSNGIIEIKEHEAYYKIRGLLATIN